MSNDSVKLISHKSLNNYVTVLAIYDEPPPSSSNISQNSKKNNIISPNVIKVSCNQENNDELPVVLRSIKFKPTNENKSDIVEITDFDKPPIHQVASTKNVFNSNIFPSKTTNNLSFNEPNKKKTEFSNLFSSPDLDYASKHTRSVSVEPTSSFALLNRNNARKSRFTEAFLDAKERLDQEFKQNNNKVDKNTLFSNFTSSKIVLDADTINLPMGIEISAVPNLEEPNKILAVEVIRIEENGRIDKDKRLKIGDQITEINGQFCANMSLSRARLCLRDLQSIAEPSLSFNRQVLQRTSTPSSIKPISIKPIKSALQEANTSQVGNTLTLTIKKGKNGFGFSFAGRMNALNEHLFYVKTVINGGASWEILRIGDRLLKIDDKDLSNLKQCDVTAILKSKQIGETIKVLASRVSIDNTDTNENESNSFKNETNNQSITSCVEENEDENVLKKNLHEKEWKSIITEIKKDNRKLVGMDIVLNDSPSAGLGISLKAQKIYNNGSSIDSGLYIRSVLHGSAAFKDGRLKVDDRLVAVENENLLKYNLNGEALKAFINCLSKMPSTAASVRIVVARKIGDESSEQLEYNNSNNVTEHCTILPKNQKSEIVEESESEASVAIDSCDAFVRDAVVRKSINEKRPLNASNDPFNSETYKRIKNFRQPNAIESTKDDVFLPQSSLSLTRQKNKKNLIKNNKRLSLNYTVNYNNDKKIQVFENVNSKFFNKQKKSITVDEENKKEKSLKRHLSCSELNNSTINFDKTYNFNNVNNLKEFYKLNCVTFSPKSTKNTTLVDGQLEKNKSFLTTSKFFDFFKTNNKKDANIVKDFKEFTNKETVLKEIKRRSVSIDCDMAHELKKNDKLSVSTLNRKKTKKKNDNQTTKENKLLLPSSTSQPLLGVKSAFKIYEKELNLKNKVTNLSPKEKRQRRKSTGSGLLKLFQKTNLNFHDIQDEKDVVKYNFLLDEKTRMKAIDEAFRKEYGLINQPNPNFLSSLKANQYTPHTLYNQFIEDMTRNDFCQLNQTNFLPKEFCNQINNVRHQRGHSTQELPKYGIINGEINNSIKQHKNHYYAEYNGCDTSFYTQNPHLYANCKLPPPPAYFVPSMLPSTYQCFSKDQFCFNKKTPPFQNKSFQSINNSPKQLLHDLANWENSKKHCSSCFTSPVTKSVSLSNTKQYNNVSCRQIHQSSADFYDYNSFNTWFVNSENANLKKKEIEKDKEKL